MGFNGVDKEMTNALNKFFAEQAEVEGKCMVDYVQFDTEYEVVYTNLPVKYAEATIDPRGGTALLDAIGRGTVELGEKLAAKQEHHRPGKVMVVVVTDGHENSSKEWSTERVKELVERQQDKYSWDYVFLGANMDAVAVGGMYGFKADKSLTFNIHDSHAIHATSASLSGYATSYRTTGKAEFSDSDRNAAQGS